MRSLDLSVYGIPAPQGSKRYIGEGRFIEASDKVAPWRRAVAQAVLSLGDVEPFTTAVEVKVVFFIPRPRSVRRIWPTVPPDLDKLCRSLGDGLSVNTKLLEDDSLIVRWDASKQYADTREPGAELTITEVTDIPLVINSL